MHLSDEFSFLRFSAEVSWIESHTLINPPKQDFKVADLKNKNAVKRFDELVEILAATTEERDGNAMIGNHGFDFVDIPKQVLVLPYDFIDFTLMGRFNQRHPRLWIAPILQFPIAVEDMVTTALQLFSYRGFAGSGNAFDQVISDTHFRFVSQPKAPYT
jgi:hypothetical protein